MFNDTSWATTIVMALNLEAIQCYCPSYFSLKPYNYYIASVWRKSAWSKAKRFVSLQLAGPYKDSILIHLKPTAVYFKTLTFLRLPDAQHNLFCSLVSIPSLMSWLFNWQWHVFISCESFPSMFHACVLSCCILNSLLQLIHTVKGNVCLNMKTS